MFILFQIRQNSESVQNIFINESEIISIEGANSDVNYYYKVFFTEKAYNRLLEACKWNNETLYGQDDNNFSIVADITKSGDIFLQIIRLLQNSTTSLSTDQYIKCKHLSHIKKPKSSLSANKKRLNDALSQDPATARKYSNLDALTKSLNL